MANVLTLLFVDVAAMLDQAAVATQAAQLIWDKYPKGDEKPPVMWELDAIRVGVVFLAKGLKHKKKEYWLDENRKTAHGQARDVATKAAQYAKEANSNASVIKQEHLQKALDAVFPPDLRPEEPCPF